MAGETKPRVAKANAKKQGYRVTSRKSLMGTTQAFIRFVFDTIQPEPKWQQSDLMDHTTYAPRIANTEMSAST